MLRNRSQLAHHIRIHDFEGVGCLTRRHEHSLRRLEGYVILLIFRTLLLAVFDFSSKFFLIRRRVELLSRFNLVPMDGASLWVILRLKLFEAFQPFKAVPVKHSLFLEQLIEFILFEVPLIV